MNPGTPFFNRSRKLCSHGVEQIACDDCHNARMAATRERRNERARERDRQIKAGERTPRRRQREVVVRACCTLRNCEVCAGLNRRVELVRKEAK